MSEYIVPQARLNYFEPKEPGNFHGLPNHDDAYPVPCDWIAANASRFYFTNKQIIEAAKPEFAHPDSDCRLWAVYFLIRNGKIVYVGQSSCLYRRLEQHLESGKEFDGVTWFEAPAMFITDIEAYYIWRCNPIMNGSWPRYRYFGDEAKKLDAKHGEKRNDVEYVTTIRLAPAKA